MGPSESLLILQINRMVSLNVKLLSNGKLHFFIQWPQVEGEKSCRCFTYSPRDPETFTDTALMELIEDAPQIAIDRVALAR
jgi:hypothetical protein